MKHILFKAGKKIVIDIAIGYTVEKIKKIIKKRRR
tara:strand:- start:130 stop:234 length:105 start_codon:yes stop_codon:yes gene_type:complete